MIGPIGLKRNVLKTSRISEIPAKNYNFASTKTRTSPKGSNKAKIPFDPLRTNTTKQSSSVMHFRTKTNLFTPNIPF